MQTVLSLIAGEENRQLHRIESLITDVTKDIELGVVQNRMWQTYHLTVRLIGCQNTMTYASDILCERHHEFLTDGVDGRIRDLCELLTEIVEERLRAIGEDSQRGIVTHCCRRLYTIHCHGGNGAVDILFAIAEHDFLLQQVGNTVLHVAATLQFLQLDTIR